MKQSQKKLHQIVLSDYPKIVAEDMVASKYIIHKKFYRPKTTVFSLLGLILFYFTGASSIMIIGIILFQDHLFLKIISIILAWLIPFFLLIKAFLIKLIECYQHYASEERRRRCLCMPTCSEYALIALRQYPLLIALKKIRTRLYRTCQGSWYKIDFP